jgi:ADP-ribose pyrophosphatase
MLGITSDGLVPLLRQYRIPMSDWVWELPAGLCDAEGEDIEATAIRELEEEAGLRAERAIRLFRGTVSPGLTDEMYNAYLCLDLSRVGPGGGIHGERIEVHMRPFDELPDWIIAAQERGELVDSKIIAHWCLAQRWLARDGRAA